MKRKRLQAIPGTVTISAREIERIRREVTAEAKRNPLFTRTEKRRIKRKIKHSIRGGVRRAVLSLVGRKSKARGGHKTKRRRSRRASAPSAASPQTALRDEVISALFNQGYSRPQAAAMVPRPSAGDDFDSLFRRAIKRNPEAPDRESEQAIKAFRGFHGANPDKVTEVIETMVQQGKFWLVGRLLGYDMHQFPLHRDEHNRNRRPNVDCWDAQIMLCADPPAEPKDKLGRQLFLYGGNQDMEWALKQHFGVASNVQLVVLGTIDRIWYVTRKSFHNFELEKYLHRFGEEGGAKPLLLYDRLNKKQWIVGGDYTITEKGIEN